MAGVGLHSAILLVVLSLTSALNDGDPAVTKFKHPIGDYRNCPQPKGVLRFEVLPGGGWDNLRNVDMGQVAFMNYSKCVMTEDGQYLIPDSTFVVPLKQSRVETFAELIEHWSNYTSMTSSSINAEASFSGAKVSVSASFSVEHQKIKTHQVNDKSVTTRVMLRYHTYTSRMNPDIQLHPDFKSRLMDIAAHIAHNNTKMADYLLELVVRDFGTHVITSIDAGATLAQLDQIKRTSISDSKNTKTGIKASASASFFGTIGIKMSAQHSSSQESSKKYLNSRTHSRIVTFGGPQYRANFSLNEWMDGLQNGLVAIDRSGDPLHFIVTPQNLPEVPDALLVKVVTGLERMINRYYKFNTIRGCVDRDSPNFSFQANTDDGSCKAPNTNFTFGGVYQTCHMYESDAGDVCSGLQHPNPLTKAYSCPGNYESILLNQDVVTKHDQVKYCRFKFIGCWSWGWKHRTSAATYMTYWCAATGHVQQNSGYIFGGIYTSSTSNPLTKSQSCPNHFYALAMGLHMHVCVSDDYELGFKSSLPFAGFFSCMTGNPLVFNKNVKASHGSDSRPLLSNYVEAGGPKAWPKRCPPGYSQHLATVERNCEINYCVRANSLGDQGLPPVRRPPFAPAPGTQPNQTNVLFLIGPAQRVWVKDDQTRQWGLSSVGELKKQIRLERGLPGVTTTMDDIKEAAAKDALSGGEVAGITVGTTAFIGLVIVIAIALWRRHGRNKSCPDETSTGGTNPYGTFVDESTALSMDEEQGDHQV